MSLRDVFVQIRKRCPRDAGLGAEAPGGRPVPELFLCVECSSDSQGAAGPGPPAVPAKPDCALPPASSRAGLGFEMVMWLPYFQHQWKYPCGPERQLDLHRVAQLIGTRETRTQGS